MPGSAGRWAPGGASRLAYFDTAGASNGRTEAANRLIGKIRRLGHAFRNYHNYRLRLLLDCGEEWQSQSTPRIRRRRCTHAPQFLLDSPFHRIFRAKRGTSSVLHNALGIASRKCLEVSFPEVGTGTHVMQRSDDLHPSRIRTTRRSRGDSGCRTGLRGRLPYR
ncbi:MAG: transposase [Mycobacterium leprae]